MIIEFGIGLVWLCPGARIYKKIFTADQFELRLENPIDEKDADAFCLVECFSTEEQMEARYQELKKILTRVIFNPNMPRKIL